MWSLFFENVRRGRAWSEDWISIEAVQLLSVPNPELCLSVPSLTENVPKCLLDTNQESCDCPQSKFSVKSLTRFWRTGWVGWGGDQGFAGPTDLTHWQCSAAGFSELARGSVPGGRSRDTFSAH